MTVVRILFTFVGGRGHFDPLVPIARAAEAVGHTVAFGCGLSMVATVAAAGFAVFPLSTGAVGLPERLPLRPVDPRREDEEFRDRFAGRAARARLPRTLALCAAWRPDVLVCDETDFGGMLAAEALGLPQATVLVMAAGSFVRAHVVGETLNELRADQNLPPDPDLAMLHRYLALSPFPPGFRDPAYPLPPTAHSFRPLPPGAGNGDAPPWLTDLGGAPTVYFTLGTVFNLESGDLFGRVLAGLRDLPIHLVVTVGRDIDPGEFGPQPPHVHIASFIPQALLLPYCSLVVSHGGSGSVVGALAHGLPSVLLPLGADQPLNAARCQALGLGRALDVVAATPTMIRDAAAAVLAEPAYRRAAERFRDEIAALPGPEHTVMLLERLAADRSPLIAA